MTRSIYLVALGFGLLRQWFADGVVNGNRIERALCRTPWEISNLLFLGARALYVLAAKPS